MTGLPLEYVLLTILQFLVMCMAVVICYRSVRLTRKAQENVEDMRRLVNLQSAMIKILTENRSDCGKGECR